VASKPRKPTRSDFANIEAYRAWKAKGTPKARPFERAGFATDYQYRKARKDFKSYVKNTNVHPIPEPTKLRKAVESQKRSIKSGRIDKSIMVPRKASGKAKRFTIYAKATFADGTHKIVPLQVPKLPTVKGATRLALMRLKDPRVWKAYYGAKSDPGDLANMQVESVDITGVILPAA
jgi:hypothetical protein